MSDNTDDPAPKKKGKKKLVVVMAGLAMLGGGAGAGVYASGLIGGHEGKPEDHGPKLVPKAEQKRGSGSEGGGEHGGAPTAGSTKPPSGTGGDKYASNYYAMEKDFTSNLQNSVHFIQVGIAVSTPYDDSVIDNLKTNDIAVRSSILMALSDTTEDQVFSAQGKQQLQLRITKAINDTLKQKEGFGGIGNTYFTSFVVQ